MTSTAPAESSFTEVPAELAQALEADRVARAKAKELICAATVRDLSEGALLEVQHATAAARKEWDLMVATAAAEIGRRSAPEFGAKGLARKNGHTTPERFLAGITGGSRREAHDLIRTGATLGEAAEHERRAAEAEQAGLPVPEPDTPVYPVVAGAVSAGDLSAAAASMITTMLDAVGDDASPEQVRIAEERIVAKTPGLSLEQLAPIVRRFQHQLQAAAAERRQEHLHDSRYLILSDRKDGAIEVKGVLDPVSAAPIRAALEGAVKDALRRRRDGDALAEDKRTTGQIRADALASFATHMLGCDQAPLAHATTRVEIRIDLDALRAGAGVADIDGAAMPISQLRRLAVDAGFLPVVLGGDSQPLDVGREQRLFTPAQRAALVHRDGGCAMCGAPVSHCEAHHIDWWSHGGRTDLDNGVLLCVACHHTVHAGGWDIDATATDVYFRPPGSVDPKRPWQLGGTAKFGITAREQRELELAARPPGEAGHRNAPLANAVPRPEHRSQRKQSPRRRKRPQPAATPAWLDQPPPDGHFTLL